MNTFEQYEVWFVTGAQLLYGGDAVIAVDAHSNEMVKGLNDSGKLPVKVVYKGTVNSSKEVTATFKAANNDDKCIGVITLSLIHISEPTRLLSCQNVDSRFAGTEEAITTLPYTVQQGNSLGDDGHGFYEPKPIGSRRPRIWTHRDTYAKEPQSGSRPLAGRKSPKPDCRMDARSCRMG